MSTHGAHGEWASVLTLSASQALSLTGTTLVMTVTALTGASLTDDAALATFPLALQFVGTMAATIPASLLMGRVGRRLGFSIGQAIGLVFALISAYAVYQGNFWLFAAGSAGLGVHNAFWQYLRFAAAEAVSRPKRARAISYVLAGGVVAAVAGPWLATNSRDLLNPALFAGSYAVLAGLCATTIVLLQTARFRSPAPAERAKGGRPLMEIARTPIFIAAVVSSALGYGVMVLVMTATPLAMAGHGFGFSDAAFVIQWHVLGMFIPSFFTGKLIDRFGVTVIITTGVLLNLGAMVLNLSGAALENFWIALVLLGAGWNFMYIGGTTLLTECYRDEERAKVQALNDFLVFATVAVCSFSSGALYSAFDWNTVNWAMAVPMGVALLTVARLKRLRAALPTN
jgi:MFS family permease